MARASPGVASQSSKVGAPSQPIAATVRVSMKEKPMAVPKVRRAPSRLRAPKRCPIFTVPAMPKPKAAEETRNMMMLALAVAARASSPIRRPTQIELIVPFSDCSMFEASVGTLNISKVRMIGPCVRSPLNGSAGALLMLTSCPPGVAVELDVEAFGQSQILGQTKLCKPAFALSQSSRIGTLGHQVDALARDVIAAGELEDFLNVGWLGDHEFEERARLGRPMREPLGHQREIGRVTGVSELGTDVILGDKRIERRMRRDRAVGLHFNPDARKHGQHTGQRRTLEQRLAAGHDQARLAERGDASGGVLLGQRDLVGAAFVVEAGAVRTIVAREAPGVGGVAPLTGEVAARQPHERARLAGRGAFALKRGEKLRLTGGGRGED